MKSEMLSGEGTDEKSSVGWRIEQSEKTLNWRPEKTKDALNMGESFVEHFLTDVIHSVITIASIRYSKVSITKNANTPAIATDAAVQITL